MGQSKLNNVNIDLNQVPLEQCAVCKGTSWKVVYLLKKLSALISPTGKATVVPIQVFACDNCSTISPIFDNLNKTEEIPSSDGPSLAGATIGEEEQPKPTTTKSGLYI